MTCLDIKILCCLRSRWWALPKTPQQEVVEYYLAKKVVWAFNEVTYVAPLRMG
jgi:hypothetical protein